MCGRFTQTEKKAEALTERFGAILSERADEQEDYRLSHVHSQAVLGRTSRLAFSFGARDGVEQDESAPDQPRWIVAADRVGEEVANRISASLK